MSMAKNLPPIFRVGSENVGKDHNKKYSYVTKEIEKEGEKGEKGIEKEESIEKKLDKIFHNRRYAFNIPVSISFAGKKITTYLATRTKDTLITLDNESIPISTITNLTIENPID